MPLRLKGLERHFCTIKQPSILVGGCFNIIRLICDLSSVSVHMKVVFVYQIRHFYKFIALCLKVGNQLVKGIGSVFGTVVHKNNGAVLKRLVICYGLDNVADTVILPVERVNIRYKSNNKLYLKKSP